MRKVNAIDLDNTLLPYDSMRYFFLLWLKNRSTFLPLIRLAVQRKCGLKNRADFLEHFLKVTGSNKDFNSKSETFGRSLLSDLSPSILKLVKDNSDPDTVNVLCTSSPRCYTQYIAEHLGWNLICSDHTGHQFVHNYGTHKVEQLMKKYPPDLHIYNYAIGDSESDLPLLKKFPKYLLVQSST